MTSQTPQAPSRQIERRVWRWSWAYLATALVSGVISMVATAAVLTAFRQFDLIYGFGSLALCWLAATVVHELGHTFAALVVGWRPVVIAVRPLALRTIGWTMAWTRRIATPKATGWVALIPGAPGQATRRNFMIIVGAGPLASFGAAAVAVAIAALWPSSPIAPRVSVPHIATGFAALSLWMGLFTALPRASAGSASDGWQLRAMMKPDYDFIGQHPFRWLVTLNKACVRLREWPDWLIDLAESQSREKPEYAELIDSLRIGKLLDTFDLSGDRHRHMIGRFRDLHGASEWITAIEAYCLAVYDHDAQGAAAVLANGPEPEEPSAMLLAAQAAIMARSGRKQEARTCLKRMIKVCRKESPYANHTFRDIQRQIDALNA